MSTGNDWKAFFNGQAAHYNENPFTQNTAAEVDFIQSLFALSPGCAVLDVGCGTGRHSIELTRRGYRVTGVDFSPAMLEVARASAADVGVEVRWVEADVTEWTSSDLFDAALCLCEGGLGLIGGTESAEAHDFAILKNVAGSLRPGGPFLITALNGYSIIRQMKDEHVIQGRFDPATMYAQYQDQWDLPGGSVIMTLRERLFIPPEMTRMLNAAGFSVDNVFGGTAGHWGRRPLSLDEVEAMYVCRRANRPVEG